MVQIAELGLFTFDDGTLSAEVLRHAEQGSTSAAFDEDPFTHFTVRMPRDAAGRGDGGLSGGAIAGIVIGVFVMVAAGVAAVLFGTSVRRNQGSSYRSDFTGFSAAPTTGRNTQLQLSTAGAHSEAPALPAPPKQDA